MHLYSLCPNPKLVEYAVNIVHEYAYDESHNIGHFLSTAEYARIILHTIENSPIENIPKDRARQIIIDAAFTHDLLDKKYRPDTADAEDGLKWVLLSECGYTADEAETIVQIINAAPYSVRNERAERGLQAVPYGRLYLATAILVDADQLDAYKPIRCIRYTEKKYAHLSREEKVNRIRSILYDRVLNYKDRYMLTEPGKLLSVGLHADLIEWLNSTNLADYVS